MYQHDLLYYIRKEQPVSIQNLLVLKNKSKKAVTKKWWKKLNQPFYVTEIWVISYLCDKSNSKSKYRISKKNVEKPNAKIANFVLAVLVNTWLSNYGPASLICCFIRQVN